MSENLEVSVNPLISKDGINHQVLTISGRMPLQNVGKIVDFEGKVEFCTDKIKQSKIDEVHVRNILSFQMALWQESNSEVQLFVPVELGERSGLYFLIPSIVKDEGYRIVQHGLMETRENIQGPTVGMAFAIIAYNLYGWYVHKVEQKKRHDRGSESVRIFDQFEEIQNNAFTLTENSKEAEIIAWAID